MRRRSATGLGLVLALSSLGGAAVISNHIAEARQGDRRAYRDALSAREDAAAALGAAPVDASAAATRTLCLRGAETVAARVARFLGARPLDAAGKLDVPALARLSRRAAEVERSVPVPQRMGRRRASDPTRTALAWLPIEPPDRICVELPEPSGDGAAHGKRRAAGAK
jgi:hypothetical protein